MSRIEEYKLEGKNIISFDLSGFKTDNEYVDLIKKAKAMIIKYPENSVYTITNMTGAIVSKNTHDIIADWVKHNKPYVRSGVVYGADATHKVIGKTASAVTQRSNLAYLGSKEEAEEYIIGLD